MTEPLFQRLRPLAFALAALALPAGAASAVAQDWPTQPIRIIAPSAAGGTVDLIARQICNHFTNAFSQACVVDNRPGGGGMIGTHAAAQAEPDGYTLTISALPHHVTAPAIATKALYDPIKDFSHIAYVGGPAIAFVASTKSGHKTLKDVIEASRKKPLLFVSPGFGTLAHLLVEVMAAKEGIETQIILTKGASQALADVVAGNVDFGSTTWSSAVGQIRAKRIVAIGQSGKQRQKDDPQVPTFRELGRDDLTSRSWFALSGPAGLPEKITQRLNREVANMLDDPKVQTLFANLGIETQVMSPAAFTAFVKAEIERWTPLAQRLRTTKK